MAQTEKSRAARESQSNVAAGFALMLSHRESSTGPANAPGGFEMSATLQ